MDKLLNLLSKNSKLQSEVERFRFNIKSPVFMLHVES